MRLKPFYDGYCVQLPNGAGQMEAVGSLNEARVVDRLVAVGAFVYAEEERAVSVRLERKVRGSDVGYWVAYKRCAGVLHKTYICEAFQLEPFTLYQAAQRLLERTDRPARTR